jgi:hypothetical protein
MSGLYDDVHLSGGRRGRLIGKTPNGTCSDKQTFEKAYRTILTCPSLVLRVDE